MSADPSFSTLEVRLLDGFDGRLTTTQWAGLMGRSHYTALRDFQFLIDRGLLEKKDGGGRSTSCTLALE